MIKGEVGKFVRKLRRAGIRVEYGGSGHLKLFKDDRYLASMSASPRTTHFSNAVLQDLRRAGVTL